MRHFLAPIVGICVVLSAAPITAQTDQPTRMHWYLERALVDAKPNDKLPVYFVMANRLGYDHWFPRVNVMHVDERRALVMRELIEHAASTQRELLDRLERHQARDAVVGVSPNWLGNFVRCKATPRAVRDVAQLDGIEEVRYDAAWPLSEIEDGVPSDAGGPRQLGGVPGNGPLNTKANRVWALGFRGQGVIAMNADTGAQIAHGDLADRLWTNPGEIPGNGIDDDKNGFIDDVLGWNFFDNNNVVNGSPTSHGTLTAGCMVGDGACSGTVTGQAPGARVMLAAIGACCPQTGPVNPAGEAAQWDAIQYAIQMGAHIQTSSHSYKNGFIPPPNYKMHREIGDNSLAAGLIRTNSTSNNGAIATSPTELARIPFNVSTPGNLPPPYIDPNQTLVGRKGGVIGVGAHDVNNNLLVSYSPRGPYAWHLDDLLAVNPAYPLQFWSATLNDYPWFGGMRQGLLKPDVTGPTNTLGLTTGLPCSLGSTSGTSTATPRVAGCMILWKSANMSLKPEDMGMIVHQSAASSGRLAGKENSWGAGRVDALRGLYLAQCVHRVDGEPDWSVPHRQGTMLTLEVDTVPNSLTALLVGTQRAARWTGGGVLGIEGNVAIGFVGSSGPTGDVRLQVFIPVGAAGSTVYTQWLTDDTAGQTERLLSSNVIRTDFVL